MLVNLNKILCVIYSLHTLPSSSHLTIWSLLNSWFRVILSNIATKPRTRPKNIYSPLAHLSHLLLHTCPFPINTLSHSPTTQTHPKVDHQLLNHPQVAHFPTRLIGLLPPVGLNTMFTLVCCWQHSSSSSIGPVSVSEHIYDPLTA